MTENRDLSRDPVSRLRRMLWGVMVRTAAALPGGLRFRLQTLLTQGAARQDADLALRELFLSIDEHMRRVDECAMRKGKGIHPKHRLMRYHDFFTANLKAGDHVLDVGCGYGAVAFSMAKAGADVVGVDFNDANIAEAQRQHAHERLRFVCTDALEFRSTDSFNVIVLSNVLEHIDGRIEWLRTLKERFTPDTWLIRVPMINRSWTVLLRRELGMPYFIDPTHTIEYTEAIFAEELAQAGLRVVHSQIAWGEIWARVVPETTVGESI